MATEVEVDDVLAKDLVELSTQEIHRKYSAEASEARVSSPPLSG